MKKLLGFMVVAALAAFSVGCADPATPPAKNTMAPAPTPGSTTPPMTTPMPGGATDPADKPADPAPAEK